MGICATYPGITHRFIHKPKGLPCCPHRTILYPQFARPLYVGFLAQTDPSTNVPMKSMAQAPFCQGGGNSDTAAANEPIVRAIRNTRGCAHTTSSGHAQQQAQLTPGMKRSGNRTVPTAAEPHASRSITAFLQHPAARLVQAQALSIGMKARYHVDQRRNATTRKFH